jgi:hypothetical protein
MDRLKHTKATVAANIRARAAARLEPPETAESTATHVTATATTSAPVAPTKPVEPQRESLAGGGEAEPASYTARLLAAKQRARQQQRRPD